MPETGQPDEKAQNQLKLEQIFDEHPGFAKADGKLTNRMGQPYEPTNLPNDPTTQRFYEAHADGQPEPASQPTPTEEPAEVEAQPPPEPEQPKPVDRLLAGKYKSPEELERGYQELLQESQRRNQENVALKAVNQHFETLAQTLRQPREEPTRPQVIKADYDSDGRPVIPAETIQRLVEEQATEAATRKIQEYLTPISQMGKATQTLRAAHPEFSQQEANFGQWLAENQQVSERVMADPDFALEAAYLMYQRDNGQQAAVVRNETTQAAQAAINETRRAAAPAGGTPGAAHRPTSVDSRDSKMSQLLDYWHKTGDSKPLRKFRLEEALGSDFLDSINRTTWGR